MTVITADCSAEGAATIALKRGFGIKISIASFGLVNGSTFRFDRPERLTVEGLTIDAFDPTQGQPFRAWAASEPKARM